MHGSPRYMHENHYAILMRRLELPAFFCLHEEHNVSFFLCLGKSCTCPDAKLVFFIDVMSF